MSARFIVLGMGSLVMVFGGSLVARVVGLTIVGLGAGPLYPLDVDRLYLAAEHRIDPVSLGAIRMLAAGVWARSLSGGENRRRRPLRDSQGLRRDRPTRTAATDPVDLARTARPPHRACPYVNNWMILHVRYRANSTISSLKCHGVFASGSPSSPAANWRRLMFLAVIGCLSGASTNRPHVGHVPSSFIAAGAQYLAQSSHHGTSRSAS